MIRTHYKTSTLWHSDSLFCLHLLKSFWIKDRILRNRHVHPCCQPIFAQNTVKYGRVGRSASSLVFMGWFPMQVNVSACIRILASLLWPRGWTPVSLSISVIDVDHITPVIRQSAWFWTLSRTCWLVFAVADHAVGPYSNWGLTVPWYTGFFCVFSLASRVVPASLRRIASLHLPFASAVAMCCFQVCLLSNVIPRYVASSSSFSGVPVRVMVPAFCFGDRVDKVVEDFSSVSAQDGIIALGKDHTHSTPSLSCLPKVALETVPLFTWLNIDCSQPWRVECRPLPFFTPLSFKQSMLWCSGLSVLRKFLKPLSTSALPSCGPDVISAVLASLSARSFPLPPVCPGQ